ncbi:ATP-dependent DNA helicase PIF1 [Trifolium pratense]|uniref:ATP-dependent DNA helicase n=1 Tax=Trifolium pratense TaxID=57577 RepID=A0A2K3P0N8_TRIPR|nr:ATP-dependent DNA helicase PIF1 [Trifolium pratense]
MVNSCSCYHNILAGFRRKQRKQKLNLRRKYSEINSLGVHATIGDRRRFTAYRRELRKQKLSIRRKVVHVDSSSFSHIICDSSLVVESQLNNSQFVSSVGSGVYGSDSSKRNLFQQKRRERMEKLKSKRLNVQFNPRKTYVRRSLCRTKNRSSRRRTTGHSIVRDTIEDCIFRKGERKGDMIIQCPDCAAMVWKGETTQKNSDSCPLKVYICCAKGKITLPYMAEPPVLIRNLFSRVDSRSANFLSNLRSCNNMFAFTSFGVKLRLFRNRNFDPRIYNIPDISEVAALIIGDFDNSEDGRDIVVQERNNQSKIRADFLTSVEEAVSRGDIDGSSVGSRVVIPSSFTGGRRYMFNNCQDAMALCKKFGYPDLFLTVTCNPKWDEIQRHLCKSRNQAPFRPDISCRVFRLKLNEMMKDFKKGQFFGKVIAGVYTIEFQKRGLPHAHILLWLDHCNKLESLESIDSVICAELPDEHLFPKLYALVSQFMIHGPCGLGFLSCPCMKEKRCSKFYPKKFVSKTSFDELGYPIYRRRDLGVTVLKKGVLLDNRSVVPYNPSLIMKYQAHVNIEFCNKSNCIKYLFKYITKGVDRVTTALEVDGEQIVDEIKQFYDCRYLSPSESIWRTFGFDIHCRWPGVTRCTFHLLNQQRITFNDNSNLASVLVRNKEKKTMFLAWMEANKIYPLGRSLTYSQFASLFVYDYDARRWHPRKKQQSIGRLTFIPISNRSTMSDPLSVFEKKWEIIADGILYSKRRALQNPDKILRANGKCLNDFECFPKIIPDEVDIYDNLFIANELAYDCDEMGLKHEELFRCLNEEQLMAYNQVVDAVNNNLGRMFFVDGFGGSGKTFLWNALSYRLRSEGKIVLNVASSGIASLLLPRGRTAHSQFGIPLILTEESCCILDKHGKKVQLLGMTSFTTRKLAISDGVSDGSKTQFTRFWDGISR